MLNREQLLAAREPIAGTVNVPEWGGEVGIRRMTAAEIVAMRDGGVGDGIEWLCRFLASVLCDAAGEPLFAADDWQQLESRGLETLMTVSKQAQKLNGIGAAEQVEKN